MSNPKPDETLTPNYAASADFLKLWAPIGPWVLVAIDPNRKEIEADTFSPLDEKRMMDWLAEQGTRKKRNCYFTVNPCIRPMKEKPSREHIGALMWLHVDLDPRSGESLDSERGRILEALKDPTSKGIPKPTCIVFSGGGYQAFWRLEKAVLLSGKAEDYEEAKRWNQQLELVLGGDACHNIDRIMRLPGTINRPNDRKRKAGRTEALAEVVEFNDTQHDLAKFIKAPAVAAPSSDGAAVSIDTTAVKRFASVDDIPELRADDDPRNAQCRVVIVQGLDPDNVDKFGSSRSEWLLFVCCQMVRAGCSDDAIYGVITDPAFAVSASVLDKGSGVHAYAVRQIERAREQSSVEVGDFQGDGQGKLFKNLHNARLAIAKLGVSVEFDEFSDRSLISGLTGFGPYLDDAALTRLRLEIDERFKLTFAKDWFVDVVMDTARRNKRHPVREFLNGLTWDGTPRLDGWLSSYLSVEDSEYSRAVGTLVLVAAVRRVRKPGCKFDEMLVLEGPQGGLKSTALKALAVVEDWFSDDLPLNAKTQQFIEQTVGKWIVEAGELKGMRKGDVESLKSCLSRSVDRSRMAYGRLTMERARQFVIIGTTNSDRYLKDNTGNRRFWPVRVGEVRIDDLRRDREQLWAEAAAREAARASIRLDPTLYGAAAQEQEGRRVQDPFVEMLGVYLNGREGKMRTTEAWYLVGVPEGQRTQDHNQRLGDAMRELGWERKQLRFGGDPEWAYAKGDISILLQWSNNIGARGLGIWPPGSELTPAQEPPTPGAGTPSEVGER